MNRHRDPAPIFRSHALPANRLGADQYDTPENRAKMERVLDAAESFEVINGRVVQVRHPVTGLPLVSRGY